MPTCGQRSLHADLRVPSPILEDERFPCCPRTAPPGFHRNHRPDEPVTVPTTRRAFLTAAGATLGAATFARPALAHSGQGPLKLLLMGDPQIGAPFGDWASHVPDAMADIRWLDHDRLVIVGDLVQNDASLYPLYESMIQGESDRPILALAGNADVNAGLSQFTATTGFPQVHHETIRGIRMIFLGTRFMTPPPPGDQHICHVGLESIQELVQILEADTATTTLLFAHAPIKGTTWRSDEEPGRQEMWLGESDLLQRILGHYPNVVFYGSGHVHYTHGLTDTFGLGAWALDRRRGVLHHTVPDTCTGSGSTMLEVHRDRIVLKTRDHGNGVGSWRQDLERTVRVPTTLG